MYTYRKPNSAVKSVSLMYTVHMQLICRFKQYARYFGQLFVYFCCEHSCFALSRQVRYDLGLHRKKLKNQREKRKAPVCTFTVLFILHPRQEPQKGSIFCLDPPSDKIKTAPPCSSTYLAPARPRRSRDGQLARYFSPLLPYRSVLSFVPKDHQKNTLARSHLANIHSSIQILSRLCICIACCCRRSRQQVGFRAATPLLTCFSLRL